ncbi:MAG: phosphoribosylanthranilate isomerase [Planctomycetota bacterium]|jgi:phosphoribosylanthranilate isomerase
MMVKVKICGITNATDALAAASAGADAIGFNFWPRSPRYIEPQEVLPIRLSLPPFLATVGVFVDKEPEQVREIMEYCGLDYAQLHGHENRAHIGRLKGLRIIKAIRVRSDEDLNQLERYDVKGFLLDTYAPGRPGGTGETFDWSLARAASSRAKIILAGGLTAENVAEAIQTARPFAVDVASGVEELPGKKSRKLLNEFVYVAKSVEL